MFRAACGFLTAAVVVLAPAPVQAAKYKIKEPVIRAAVEYPAHQDFQNLVIAAWPCHTLERTLDLFDTPKLHEKGIMPVLLVIENRNPFPVWIQEEDILLLAPDGSRQAPIPFTDVLLEISLKKPLSNYSTRKDLLLQKSVKKEMFQDFEHKAFDEKLVSPAGGSEYGVVFYRLPEGGDLAGYSLYLPTVLNFAEKEPLMFFEFELLP
ncbi:MAG: hypothetical protein Kow001_09370 [Acidobacteriota bacterium]